MLLNTEKQILNIIKFGAVIPILFFSLVITFYLVNQKNIELKQEINELKEFYISSNKENVKNEVLRVTSAIDYSINTSEKKLKIFLKNKVYEAHKIAENIYKEEKSHKNGHSHTDKHVLETIKHALGGMTYNNGRGYIFIDNEDGVKLLQPLNKSMEGKNLLEYEDTKGYKFVKKIVRTIKNKSESYDKYYWYKSKKDKISYEKMSFYKYFEPLNIAIGTGEYLNDFKKDIQNKLLNKIRNIKFDKNGYIFILDSKGSYLSHKEKERIGTNGFNEKNKSGDFVIRDIINFSKKNTEGFLSYSFPNIYKGNLKDREKLSFIKYSNKWEWIVGAGFYASELNLKLKKKEQKLIDKYDENIFDILILCSLITILLLIMSFYVSKIISNKFSTYKYEIDLEVKKTIEKEELLYQQSKLAAMGEMIGNIAHQWRQPLSVISTAATGAKLEYELGYSSDSKLNYSFDMINNSAQYLSQTIEDFRSFLDPKNNKSKEFNVLDMFDKTFNLLEGQFKAKNIIFEKEIEPNNIESIENEIIQVLMNILNNSKDALELVEFTTKLIFVKSYLLDDVLYIEIKDNAGGIKEDILDRIFEPYFTTKHKSQGTGIGLYMSQDIVRNHLNGNISVCNESYEYLGTQCKGAKFTIEIGL